MKSRLVVGAASVVLLAAFVGACGDLSESVAPSTASLETTPTLAAVRCDVTVASGKVACGSATAAGLSLSAGPITLGGQGDYVLIRSANVAYAATVFSFDVTVQNRLAEALGTEDGTTPDAAGIRVVLAASPQVTGGTGAITSLNADGVATYTAPSQPYWQYAAPLAPGVTSAAKAWQFTVPATVTTFSFQVFVRAQVPDPSSFLRVRPMNGGGPLNAVACPTSTACVAVGDAGSIMRTDGGTWTAQASGTTSTLQGVACANASDCIAVGSGGTIIRWNGATWSAMASPTGTGLAAIACTGASDCAAVGSSGTIVRWNGTVWGTATSPTAENFAGVTCTSASDCVAVGAAGTIVRWNGTAWSTETSGTANALSAVHCATTSACVAAGASGTLVRWNGSAWATETSPAALALRGVQCTSATICVAVGAGGTIARRNGAGVWTSETSPSANAFNGLACAAANACAAVGEGGTIVRWDGATWTGEATGISTRLAGVSCVSASFCMAVGDSGRNVRWDGSAWREQPRTFAVQRYLDAYLPLDMRDVACTSSRNCIAAGPYSVVRWNGSYFEQDYRFGGGLLVAAYTGVACAAANDCLAARDFCSGVERWNGSDWQSSLAGCVFALPLDVAWRGVTCRAVGDCRAVSDQGVIGRLSGTTWSLDSVADSRALRSVSCPSASFCVAVGGSGAIVHRDTSTGIWNALASPTGTTLNDVECSSTTECMAVGNSGTVVRWNGAAWRVIPSFTSQHLNSLSTLASRRRVMVGDGGLIRLAEF